MPTESISPEEESTETVEIGDIQPSLISSISKLKPFTSESISDKEKIIAPPKTIEELKSEYIKHCLRFGYPIGRLIEADMTDRRFKAGLITPPFADRDGVVLAGEVTTIYNTTAPNSQLGGILAARVEPKGWQTAETTFFDASRVDETGRITQIDGAVILPIQDPFIMNINGVMYIGGVEIFNAGNGVTQYRTKIYPCTNGIDGLKEQGGEIIKPAVEGPPGMKGIRLVELPNGSIGVFTRPQGGAAGWGKIGYTEVRSVEDISDQVLEGAELIPGLFTDEEWGGVNEASLRPDGRINVLGHIARFANAPAEPELKEYYAITFVFDPASHTFSDLKMIATADCLPDIEPKMPSLKSKGGVMYSSGLVGNDLYAGIGDTGQGIVHLLNSPFAEAA